MGIRFEPQPPDDVRDKMIEIFRRKEFAKDRGFLESILRWIVDRLRELFPDTAVGGAGAGWGGPVAQVVLWVVLVALVAFLVWMIVKVVRRGRPPKAKPAPKAAVTIDEHRTAKEWAGGAAEFEAAGNWKEAIRCRYRELVTRLVDLGFVPGVPGRTTGELRADVAERLPGASHDFSNASQLFELPWYADVPTGPEENAQFRALATAILDRASEPEPVGVA